MRLYLDDDLDGNILIGLLQHAGHTVVSPRAVSRLDQARISLRNTYQNLNFWREPRR